MKRVLLLGRKHSINKEKVEDMSSQLSEKLIQHGFQLDTAMYSDLLFDMQKSNTKIINSTNNLDLKEYDFVFMMSWYSYVPTRRDMALAIAKYLDFHKVPFANKEAYYNRSSSKISQMMICALEGIDIPHTLFSLNKKLLKDYANQVFGDLAICKDASASRGAGNYLCTNKQELEEALLNSSEKTPYLVQEYIDNDGSDLRVVIMGYDVSLVIKRQGSGDNHLTNTSQGGSASLLDIASLDEKLISVAKNVAKLFHRDITGVDIMYQKNSSRFVVLESNALPQLASGSFVEQKMDSLANYIVTAATTVERN